MPNLDFQTECFAIWFSLTNIKEIGEFLDKIGAYGYYDFVNDEYFIRYGDKLFNPCVGDTVVYTNGKLQIKKGDEDA